MRLLFLILLIVTNVHAMERQDDTQNNEVNKRDTPYSYQPKYEIIEKHGHQDPIFVTDIDWFLTLMIPAGANYLPFNVKELYKWLIEQGKEKIPGIEIKATEVQKELVKLYYEALPLIGNRTAKEIEDIAVKLFEIHLTGKYIYDNSLQEFLTDKKNELNEEGLIIVKRFIRFHNIDKVYDILQLPRNEAREFIFDNLPKSTMHKPYALRQSQQRNIDGKALTGRIIISYLNDKTTVEEHIIYYHSGEGFYMTISAQKNIYFSNFLDLINHCANVAAKTDIKNFLTYSSIKNTAPQNLIDTVHINNNGNIKKLSITYLYEKNEPYDGIILNDKQKDLISFYFSCINLLPDNMKDNKDKINEIVSVLFSLDLNEHEHEIASIIDDHVESYKPISNFIDDKGKLNDKGKNFLRRFLTLDHVTRFTNEAKQSKNNTYSKLHTWLKLMMSDAEILGLDILQRTIIQ